MIKNKHRGDDNSSEIDLLTDDQFNRYSSPIKPLEDIDTSLFETNNNNNNNNNNNSIYATTKYNKTTTTTPNKQYSNIHSLTTSNGSIINMNMLLQQQENSNSNLNNIDRNSKSEKRKSMPTPTRQNSLLFSISCLVLSSKKKSQRFSQNFDSYQKNLLSDFNKTMSSGNLANLSGSLTAPGSPSGSRFFQMRSLSSSQSSSNFESSNNNSPFKSSSYYQTTYPKPTSFAELWDEAQRNPAGIVTVEDLEDISREDLKDDPKSLEYLLSLIKEEERHEWSYAEFKDLIDQLIIAQQQDLAGTNQRYSTGSIGGSSSYTSTAQSSNNSSSKQSDQIFSTGDIEENEEVDNGKNEDNINNESNISSGLESSLESNTKRLQGILDLYELDSSKFWNGIEQADLSAQNLIQEDKGIQELKAIIDQKDKQLEEANQKCHEYKLKAEAHANHVGDVDTGYQNEINRIDKSWREEVIKTKEQQKKISELESEKEILKKEKADKDEELGKLKLSQKLEMDTEKKKFSELKLSTDLKIKEIKKKKSTYKKTKEQLLSNNSEIGKRNHELTEENENLKVDYSTLEMDHQLLSEKYKKLEEDKQKQWKDDEQSGDTIYAIQGLSGNINNSINNSNSVKSSSLGNRNSQSQLLDEKSFNSDSIQHQHYQQQMMGANIFEEMMILNNNNNDQEKEDLKNEIKVLQNQLNNGNFNMNAIVTYIYDQFSFVIGNMTNLINNNNGNNEINNDDQALLSFNDFNIEENNLEIKFKNTNNNHKDSLNILENSVQQLNQAWLKLNQESKKIKLNQLQERDQSQKKIKDLESQNQYLQSKQLPISNVSTTQIIADTNNSGDVEFRKTSLVTQFFSTLGFLFTLFVLLFIILLLLRPNPIQIERIS